MRSATCIALMDVRAYTGRRLERVRASKQFEDGAFRNTAPVGVGIKGNPLPLLGEYFFGKSVREPPAPLPVCDPLPRWNSAPETGFRATWLGHSTVLLELDGARVLTDPVFGERASPVGFAGPRRFHPTPVALDALPPLDAVLLSHNHYDHLCRQSMVALGRRGVPIVTSLGVGAQLEAMGIAPSLITELDWYESSPAPSGKVRFHAAPSQHFSGRTLHDRNQTLWSSWVIESDRRRVFFSGDTGLTEEYREVGRGYGPFDLTMLEVGAFHPSWADIHLGPENALKAHAMLGGGALLPVHWGTFNLALHAWDEPAETLLALAPSQPNTRILTPRLGDPIEPTRHEATEPWWRSATGSLTPR